MCTTEEEKSDHQLTTEENSINSQNDTKFSTLLTKLFHKKAHFISILLLMVLLTLHIFKNLSGKVEPVLFNAILNKTMSMIMNGENKMNKQS